MNALSNKRFKTKYILYFLLMMPFLRTRTLEDYPVWLKNLYNCSAMLSSFIIIFLNIANQKKAKNIRKIIPVLMLPITYILVTIFNLSNIGSCYNCLFFIAMALFVNDRLNNDTQDFIKFLATIYTTAILINNILVLIFPTGFYAANAYHSGHLLGDDNAIIYVALPGMIIATINSLLQHEKITKFTWFNLLFCQFIFIRLWAASAIIAFAMFMFILVLDKNNIKISPKKLSLGLAVFCLTIFIGFNLSIITNFVTNYLQKDVTFSGRVYLWQYAFELFHARPLIGYGGYYVVGRSLYHNRMYPVHTTHLQILVDGGLVLLSVYIIMLISSFSKLAKSKKNSIAQIISAGLVGMGISYTFEQAGLYHLIIITTFALNINKIISCRKENEENDA